MLSDNFYHLVKIKSLEYEAEHQNYSTYEFVSYHLVKTRWSELEAETEEYTNHNALFQAV